MKAKLVVIGLLLVIILLMGAVSVYADRSALTVQNLSAATPITPVYVTPVADGHSFANDGKQFVHIKNSSGSTIYITITTPATVGGMAIADVNEAITTGTERMIGPFDPTYFNNSGGTVYVDYSAISVTVGAFKLP